MPYFGRRTLYLWGMFGMGLALTLVGVLNVWNENPDIKWAQAALCMVWNLMFDMTVGQLGWSLPAEVGSTRLRQKTICLARNAYYLVNIVAGVLQPYFVNPTAWNLNGYTGEQFMNEPNLLTDAASSRIYNIANRSLRFK